MNAIPPIQAPYEIKAKRGRFYDVITDSKMEESFLRYSEAKGDVVIYHPRPKFRGLNGRTYELDVLAIDPESMLCLAIELKPHRTDTWIVDNPEDTTYQMHRLMTVREKLPNVGLAYIPWAAEFKHPRIWVANIPKPFGDGRWVIIDDTDPDRPRRIGWDTLWNP